MKDNASGMKANLGGPSIILIILVLAMSVFALLALRSSSGERKLAVKTADSIRNYYDMNSRAEEIYAEIDDIVRIGLGDISEQFLWEIPEVTDVWYEPGVYEDVSYFVSSEIDETVGISASLRIYENVDKIDVLEWKLSNDSSDEVFELELLD